MKKLILTCLAFTFTVLVAAAQADQPGPIIQFDTTVVDYGTIAFASEPVREFRYTNVGTDPLILTSVKSSCGCLVPSYSNEPLWPGKSAVIKVRYDTRRVGPFVKTLTVDTNEKGTSTHVLTIKGVVNQPPAEAPSIDRN